jgi:hypothetical protein
MFQIFGHISIKNYNWDHKHFNSSKQEILGFGRSAFNLTWLVITSSGKKIKEGDEIMFTHLLPLNLS